MLEDPSAAPRRQGMSTLAKVLIGCGCFSGIVVISLVVAGYLFFRSGFTMDPARVQTFVQRSLPNATIPAGYQGFLAIDFFGFRMAMIGPTPPPGTTAEKAMESSDGLKLILVQAPAGAGTTRAQMRTQMQQGLQGKGGADTTLRSSEALGSEEFLVGGTAVTFDKARGKNDTGKAMLQYTGMLERTDGAHIMFFFVGPEEGFDLAAMKAFLASAK